jgi:hypothetical protein
LTLRTTIIIIILRANHVEHKKPITCLSESWLLRMIHYFSTNTQLFDHKNRKGKRHTSFFFSFESYYYSIIIIETMPSRTSSAFVCINTWIIFFSYIHIQRLYNKTLLKVKGKKLVHRKEKKMTLSQVFSNTSARSTSIIIILFFFSLFIQTSFKIRTKKKSIDIKKKSITWVAQLLFFFRTCTYIDVHYCLLYNNYMLLFYDPWSL